MATLKVEIEGIKAGLKYIKAGRTHSHADVMAHMDAKIERLKIKAKPLSRSKADVLEDIKEAVEEVKLIKQGKIKGISAKELLNEL